MSLSRHEETKDFEFEMMEYLDNSDPHPPPEESISSEKIFDNCDDPEMISEADSLIVPVPSYSLSTIRWLNDSKWEI
jgi:hypothetical protein